jgi:hypothetical protein
MNAHIAIFGLLLLAGCATAPQPAVTGSDTDAQSRNMVMVGSDPLQGRSAYQPSIHRQGDRWIAYIGHHGGRVLNPLTGIEEANGTSIVDVSDPARPRYLHHIPGQPGNGETGGAQMTRLCDGRSLPRGDPQKVYLLRTFGQEAHEIWDVTTPEQPTLLTRITGLRDTHKSWWECETGVAYLVSGVPGWRAKRMTRIMDLGDPTHPVFIRDFGLPGQEPGSSGPLPPDLHGPISLGAGRNRVYFAYGPDSNGVLQIVDRSKLLSGAGEPTPVNLLAPQVGRLDLSPLYGAHTSFPLPAMSIPAMHGDRAGATRDFVMLVGETTKSDCQTPRQMVLFVDVTIEDHPVVVSSYTVPDEDGRFCARSGRFGAHASNESFASVFYEKLTFISHFNAGVRVLDIRDPYRPREVGFYIPATTDRTCEKSSLAAPCRRVVQTNNVETDARGLVFIVDRANTGMHILRLTGEAASIAGSPD